MSFRSDVVSHPFTAELIRQKARKLCRKPGFSRSDEEDLSQGMYLYLWERSRLFDPKRGTIEAFVITAVSSWEGMERRRRRAKKRRDGFHALSLESTMVACDGDLDALAGVLEESDGVRQTQRVAQSLLDELEIRDEYRTIFTQLTKREQRLLEDVIELGVAGTARKRRVSRRRIDRRVRQIRERFVSQRADDDRAPDNTAASGTSGGPATAGPAADQRPGALGRCPGAPVAAPISQGAPSDAPGGVPIPIQPGSGPR